MLRSHQKKFASQALLNLCLSSDAIMIDAAYAECGINPPR